MAEFLVSGYYGDKNAGDEALLAGMVRALRGVIPEASFTVISKKAAETRAVHGVAAISRNDFRSTWRAIGRADMLISGGGSLLQDVTSTKSLLYYLGVITLGKVRGKPVAMYAQGIGPVNRPVSRAAITTIVNGVDLITVRDRESAETLRRLHVGRPRIAVTADPAIALGPSDPEQGAALLREAGASLNRPVIGVSVRAWAPARGGRPWEPALARSLDKLGRATGASIVFVPMQVPRDVQAARVIAGLMETPSVVVQGDLTHTEVRAMVARCDLLIGMRYHALVFAAMNGVPLVGLSYDPKTDSFLRMIGETVAGTTERLDSEALVDAARRALSEAAPFRARLQHKMVELTALSHRNAQLVAELLRKRGVHI